MPKSLLEQIADIADPTPKDYDIEDAGIDDNAFTANRSDTDSDDDEGDAREHYIDMGKSKLRQKQGIGQLGPKYEGSKVSRKDLYSSSSSNSSNSSSSSSSSEEEEEVDSSSESENELDEAVEGSNDNRVKEEIKRLEEGEKALLQSITKTAQSDVEKGRHVLNQTKLWEASLDARIRVQKVVVAANELPSPQVFEELQKNSGKLGDAQQSVRLLLGSLVDLQNTLNDQNTQVKEAMQSRKRKTSEEREDELEMMWEELQELRDGFRPYREQALEKWGNRIQISAGVTATKKFKAVNQGILHQIEQTLAGTERLVERTQLKRAQYKILGHSEDNEEAAKVDGHLKDRDAEIFDDTDFYQQLLRELIESRMVDSSGLQNGTGGMRWESVRQQTKASRRKVDTRASKGRKIRYHVMEKLQSFMPPVPAGDWHEDKVNELFCSLLGQSVPESMLAKEDQEETTITGRLLESGQIDASNQDLRLFG